MWSDDMFELFSSIATFFKDILASDGLGNFSNFVLAAVALYGLYVARREFEANQSAKLMVSRTYRKVSRSEDNVFLCQVDNKGKGLCLDAFLILKSESEKDGNSQYYLSNPSREINPGDSAELTINFGDTLVARKNIEYTVLYLDFFGDYYVAGGSLNYDLKTNTSSKFTTPAKRPSYLKLREYKKWMNKARKSGNVASRMNPESRNMEKAQELFKDWDIEKFFEVNKEKDTKEKGTNDDSK